MRLIAMILIALMFCGCQSQFEKDVDKLERENVILELKVRKAKLLNSLEFQEERLYESE